MAMRNDTQGTLAVLERAIAGGTLPPRLAREARSLRDALADLPRVEIAAAGPGEAAALLEFVLGTLPPMAEAAMALAGSVEFRMGNAPSVEPGPTGEVVRLPHPILSRARLSVTRHEAEPEETIAALHAAILSAQAVLWLAPAGRPVPPLARRLWAGLPVEARDRTLFVRVGMPSTAEDAPPARFRGMVELELASARRAAPGGDIVDPVLFRSSGAEAFGRAFIGMLKEVRAEDEAAAQAFVAAMPADVRNAAAPRPVSIAARPESVPAPAAPPAPPAAAPPVSDAAQSLVPLRGPAPPPQHGRRMSAADILSMPRPRSASAPARPRVDPMAEIRAAIAETARFCAERLAPEAEAPDTGEIFARLSATLHRLRDLPLRADELGEDGAEFLAAAVEAEDLIELMGFEGDTLALDTAAALFEQVAGSFLERTAPRSVAASAGGGR